VPFVLRIDNADHLYVYSTLLSVLQ